MLRFFRTALLPASFFAALLAGVVAFQSHPPREQADLAALDRMTTALKQAFPKNLSGKIRVAGLPEEDAVWLRYFAAPQPFALLPPHSGDTVLTLRARQNSADYPAMPIRQLQSGPFQLAWERLP